MKPRFITSLILFISAYSPLLLILAVKDINFCGYYFEHPGYSITLIGIIIFSIILLYAITVKIKTGSYQVEIISVKNRTLDIINYTIPYLFTAFDIDLAKPADVITIILFLSILFILTIRAHASFVNPLLALCGYSYYDIEYKHSGSNKSVMVISKFELKPKNEYYIRSLTPFLYFVTKEGEGNVTDHPTTDS